MAQIAFVELGKNWELLEDLISEKNSETFVFDSNKTYEIESRGQGFSYLCESENEPLNDEGVILDPSGMKIVRYKTGNNLLYVKTSHSSWLNITVMGE